MCHENDICLNLNKCHSQDILGLFDADCFQNVNIQN